MAALLAATIVIWPLLEIASLVWLAERIGLPACLILVALGFLAGLAVLRRTGLRAVQDVRASLSRGVEPGHSLIDAAVFAIAGLLLIVPGPLSDVVALVLMLPATRGLVLRRMASHFDSGIRPGATIIEGTFEVVNEDDSDSGHEPPSPSLGGGGGRR